MSYLVLARKWRPKTFAEVAGQPHIVRALENALSSGRVHHAFLFAGTRGVGKTTLARILAKALNCQDGVGAEPCGQCDACVAIDEGRFLDLIEVDAASRTKVEDTRELLENVQYTPSGGRFKVYLIDEVHMLSNHSFNALLKTLEEPPPHVKFLLATTDPQKLPVTVLSRCLQFNLKRLSTKQIVERMTEICAAEDVDAEPAALKRLARAAAGSMRDALSLLDQALAYGQGRLGDEDIAAMLGSMDRHRIVDLLHDLKAGEGPALLARLQHIDELVPDYEIVLDELATALQRIAVIQLAGRDALEDEDELESLEQLAEEIDPERVQLFYQIAITGRRDLGLAPDPRIGFEMTLLRMLAFQPVEDDRQQAPLTRPARPEAVAGGERGKVSAQSPATKNSAETTPAGETPVGKSPAGKSESASAGNVRARPAKAPASPEELQDWPAFVSGLDLDGAARQLAENSALESSSPFDLRLTIQRSNEHLLTDKLKGRLVGVVQERMGSGVKVHFRVTDESGETIAARAAEQARQDMDQARDAIETDPKIREIVDMFDAEVVPESVQPRRTDLNGDS